MTLTKEKGGQGLIGFSSCIQSGENNLGWYLKNSVEPVIQDVRIAEVVDTKMFSVKMNSKGY